VAITGWLSSRDVSVASGDQFAPVMVLAAGPGWCRSAQAEIARLPADAPKGQLRPRCGAARFDVFVRARFGAALLVGRRASLPCGWTAAEVPLEPYDNVLIFRQPTRAAAHSHDSGEVSYPVPTRCVPRTTVYRFLEGGRVTAPRIRRDSFVRQPMTGGNQHRFAKSTTATRLSRQHHLANRVIRFRIPEYSRVSASRRVIAGSCSTEGAAE